MSEPTTAIYFGDVVHKRLRPVEHAFKYRVFSCLFDCQNIDAIAAKTRFFSKNKFNLFSFFDKDHTPDGTVYEHAKKLANEAGHGSEIRQFFMLCYPRILGYVFNPLTVYYGLDKDKQIRLIIYQVSNTFGGRHTYVVPTDKTQNGTISQSCAKRFYVSPFNDLSGQYHFRVTPPSDSLTVGVNLRTIEGPKLKTHFRGEKTEFSDRNLLRGLLSIGWLTVKVTAAIHYEAFLLGIKGLRFARGQGTRGPTIRAHRTSYLEDPKEKIATTT